MPLYPSRNAVYDEVGDNECAAVQPIIHYIITGGEQFYKGVAVCFER